MIDTTLQDRFHHVLRTVVSERPAIYLPFARRKYPGPSPEVISHETEFVIDGYTRCASTFAVYAFQLAQPRPVRMAHHLHAPAQLIAAAKADIPTLVLIRDPAGAILSQVIREPGVSIRDALFSYTRFYDKLEPHRSSYVVADFEQTTTAFGHVIRRVNERFGTSYAEFDHTDRERRAVRRADQAATEAVAVSARLRVRNGHARASEEGSQPDGEHLGGGAAGVGAVHRPQLGEGCASRALAGTALRVGTTACIRRLSPVPAGSRSARAGDGGVTVGAPPEVTSRSKGTGRTCR